MAPEEDRLALLVDYENLAIGAREQLGLSPFDFTPILDSLAERGRVVVRRAYADWSFFDEDRRALASHHVELIDIPQRLRGSRKNAADIKMAVDAMELAFEREYLTTFVICTGDSDFTPLVHKLREHNRRVLGFGVKASTSALLPPACDEFTFYENLEGIDVLPRRRPRRERRRPGPPAPVAQSESGGNGGNGGTGQRPGTADEEVPGEKSLDDLSRLITRTLGGMQQSSEDGVLASNLKRTLLRKDPTFTETDYGFRSLGELLRHLEARDVVSLSPGPAQGDPTVRFSEESDSEEFALLADVVTELQSAGGPVLLSGLKDRLRKRQPGFSEADLGYRSFLQFCKAARTRGVVDFDWDDEQEDYVLLVPGS